jgi:hypothetical protein
MLTQLDMQYSLQRFKVRKGRKLQTGEVSETGVYLVVSKKGVILRAGLNREVVELYRDESREIYVGRMAR